MILAVAIATASGKAIWGCEFGAGSGPAMRYLATLLDKLEQDRQLKLAHQSKYLFEPMPDLCAHYPLFVSVEDSDADAAPFCRDILAVTAHAGGGMEVIVFTPRNSLQHCKQLQESLPGFKPIETSTSVSSDANLQELENFCLAVCEQLRLLVVGANYQAGAGGKALAQPVPPEFIAMEIQKIALVIASMLVGPVAPRPVVLPAQELK